MDPVYRLLTMAEDDLGLFSDKELKNLRDAIKEFPERYESIASRAIDENTKGLEFYRSACANDPSIRASQGTRSEGTDKAFVAAIMGLIQELEMVFRMRYFK